MNGSKDNAGVPKFTVENLSDLKELAAHVGWTSTSGAAMLWAVKRIEELEEEIDGFGDEMRVAMERAES